MAAEDYFNDDDWDGNFEEDDGWVNGNGKGGYYGGSVKSCPSKPLMNKTTWNGHNITLMDTSHLMNAILWCEKKYATAQENFRKCHSTGQFYFTTVSKMFPAYKGLRKEWKARNPIP